MCFGSCYNVGRKGVYFGNVSRKIRFALMGFIGFTGKEGIFYERYDFLRLRYSLSLRVNKR